MHHNIFSPQNTKIRQITIEILSNGKSKIGIVGDTVYKHSDGRFITLSTDIAYAIEELPENIQAITKNLIKF